MPFAQNGGAKIAWDERGAGTPAYHNFFVACPQKSRETVLGFLAEVDATPRG